MVSVCKEDRDGIWILWVDDIDRISPAPVEIRFTRVVFGVSVSPFLLNTTLYHHLEKYQKVHPRLVDTLLKSIYVDDVTYGANTEEDAYQLYTLSKKAFAEAGFNLWKLVTSSASLHQRITDELPSAQKPPTLDTNSRVVEEDTTYTSGLLEGNMPEGQKVLGVSWNPISDVLEFDIRGIAKSFQSLAPTKRNIIGFAWRFYDPLGFWHLSLYSWKSSFRSYANPRMIHCQVNYCVNGNICCPGFKKLCYQCQGTTFVQQTFQGNVHSMDSVTPRQLHMLLLSTFVLNHNRHIL